MRDLVVAETAKTASPARTRVRRDRKSLYCGSGSNSFLADARRSVHSGRLGSSSVDFFIAGAQKCGTTALDHYFRSHPQIQMARTKEVHYFDDETINWSAPDRDRLESQFDWSVTDVIRGEATPIYVYWPHALARMAAYNATAKLIIGLRHPTYRAFSHWRMETKRGHESLSFERAVGPEGRRRVQDAPWGVHRVFSYVERSLYSRQVATILRLFPPEQVYFFRTDLLWREHTRIISDVQGFLRVSQSITEQRRYVVPVDTRAATHLLSRETRARLDKLFAEDIQKTAALTKLDLSDWMEQSYEEAIELESL